MANNAEHRKEDEAFLNDMDTVLGPKVLGVLAKIQETLGLDYGGIDFSVGPDGEVLFFEANATMVIAPPEADPKWAFRRAPVQRVLDAVTAMLLSRIRAAS
jgi:glutathione synthase/RimK-type ligase-like ATP-grasp enzyme